MQFPELAVSCMFVVIFVEIERFEKLSRHGGNIIKMVFSLGWVSIIQVSRWMSPTLRPSYIHWLVCRSLTTCLRFIILLGQWITQLGYGTMGKDNRFWEFFFILLSNIWSLVEDEIIFYKNYYLHARNVQLSWSMTCFLLTLPISVQVILLIING